MFILAIDTALDACSVAVFDTATETFPALETEVIGKGHAERLMAMIETTMAKAGLRFPDLGRIAVTVGPGSFTGIRVGLAAARGIGLAGKLPVVGISTLDAIAKGAPGDEPVMIALDARRSEVYVATYDAAREMIGEPDILTVDEAITRARAAGSRSTAPERPFSRNWHRMRTSSSPAGPTGLTSAMSRDWGPPPRPLRATETALPARARCQAADARSC